MSSQPVTKMLDWQDTFCSFGFQEFKKRVYCSSECIIFDSDDAFLLIQILGGNWNTLFSRQVGMLQCFHGRFTSARPETQKRMFQA